jgi:hypothetical protein
VNESYHECGIIDQQIDGVLHKKSSLQSQKSEAEAEMTPIRSPTGMLVGIRQAQTL